MINRTTGILPGGADIPVRHPSTYNGPKGRVWNTRGGEATFPPVSPALICGNLRHLRHLRSILFGGAFATPDAALALSRRRFGGASALLRRRFSNRLSHP
jgi:hypothetical protein